MGGKRFDRPGSFMEPTILTDAASDNPVFRDEFSGPGGSVFTSDPARGERAASRIETRMMFINISWSDAEPPFAGIKHSGNGRELGDMGIQQFVNKKSVGYAAVEAPV